MVAETPSKYVAFLNGRNVLLGYFFFFFVFQVMIPVPPTVFSALPPGPSRLGLIEFQLVPIFFNVGVNEQALLADKFGDMSAVNATNLQSFERLDNYHHRFQKLMTEYFPGKSEKLFNFDQLLRNFIISKFQFSGTNDSRLPLSSILSQLHSELASNKVQNIAIHSLAEIAVRKMKGIFLLHSIFD